MTEKDIGKLTQYILRRLYKQRVIISSENVYPKLRAEDVFTAYQAKYILLCKMLYESEIITEEEFNKIFNTIIEEFK